MTIEALNVAKVKIKSISRSDLPVADRATAITSVLRNAYLPENRCIFNIKERVNLGMFYLGQMINLSGELMLESGSLIRS